MPSVLGKRRMNRSARRVVRRRTRRSWLSAGNRPVSLRSLSVPNANYNVFRVTRTADYGYIDIHATDPVLGAKSFKLNDLPSPGDITTFFEQYRIAMIKCTFIPNNPIPVIAGTTPTTVYAPTLNTVIDNDDDTTPGSTSVLLQYDTLKNHGNATMGKWVRYIRPSVNEAAQITGGGFTGTTTKQDQWIDSGSAGVKHYGLKYSIEGQGTNAAAVAGAAVRFYATFYLECRKAL